MINHEHKFLFIHVPRTSGSSIELQFGYSDIGPGRKPMPWKHWTLNQWQQHLDAATFDEYFKFTIVRNPWDRMISKYCAGNFFGPIGLRAGRSLKYFLDEYHHLSNMDNVGHWNRWRKWEYGETLVDYFNPEQMDYVGRFETREESLDYISQKINVPLDNDVQIRGCQADFRRENVDHHYTNFYDDETKSIVAERYAKDIEYFGYEFGE
jgi:hypothetical protein